MGEFFNFVLNFKLRCFRGRKGVIALSSLAGALFYLWLWGLEQNVVAWSGDNSMTEILWPVIVSLAFFSVLMAYLNYRSEQKENLKDLSDKRDS